MSQNDGNKSLTSTNRWTYVPGRKITLVPINIQDIKKQLESEDESDLENEEEIEIAEDEHAHLNKSFNEGSPERVKPTHELVFENKSNKDRAQSYSKYNSDLNNTSYRDKPSHKQSFLNTLIEEPEQVSSTFSNKVSMVSENKENFSSNVQPMDLSHKKKNDSFDLDFSALSLNTPVKKVEKNFNYCTPKINIIPPTETKPLPSFKTPNIVNKPNAFFSKPLFKTPINNKPLIHQVFSAKRYHGTPYSTAAECQKSESVIYTGPDGFNRILVNNVEYIVYNMLGRGGSSEVYCGFNQLEESYVAIKLVSLTDRSSADSYINEVKLLESLQNCERIVKMYDYEIRDEKLIVVLEKGGEDLNTILKQLATKQSRLPTYMILFYWMEMLYAVKEIHANGVIHSDLKPANFLRSESGLKLIDFGIASKVQDNMTCAFKTNQEGTCNYISPEALGMQGDANSPNYGKSKYKIHFKSDVWSLGCILYQLVYRRTPFQHINQIWSKLAAITNPNHKISYPEAEWTAPAITDTLKKCLQYDIKSRPSVDELIEEYEHLLKNIHSVKFRP